MAEEPDRLRRDIESTRASLTRDVDLLAEKTSPTRVARRRWTAVKERVMGSADYARHAASDTTSSAAGTVQDKASQLGDKAQNAAGTISDKAQDAAGTISDKAQSAADAVRSAPRAVAGQAQGNPIAAGIIAFGVGLLAATLIPVTDSERRAGQQLKERGDDLTDQMRDMAGELRDDLSGTVQQAAGQVKETAREGVQATKEEAKDQTRQATHNAS